MKIALILRPDMEITEDSTSITLTSAYTVSLIEHNTLALVFLDSVRQRNYSLKELKELCQIVARPEVFEEFIRSLAKDAMFSLAVKEEDKEILTVNPIKKSILFVYKNLNALVEKEEDFPLGQQYFSLSPHVIIKSEQGKTHVQSGASQFYLTLNSSEMLSFFFHLAKSQDVESLQELTNFSIEKVQTLINILYYCGMLVTEKSSDDTHLAFWEFHDLLYHQSSTFLPEEYAKAISNPSQDKLSPAPLVKAYKTAFMALMPPSQNFPSLSFLQVLESRNSNRHFSHASLGFQNLSDFLYLSARVKKIKEDNLGGTSFRPSPSAGGVHGLEIYLIINKVEKLDKGIYHYHPVHHILEKIPLPTDSVETFMDHAKKMTFSMSVPQVFIVITARYRRYQFKYQKIAYKNLLKDTGCLQQTMSLVAAYLQMHSVIVNDTPLPAFTEIMKFHPLAEGVVGTFSLGV